MLLLNAVRRISEDFCMLREARREVLEDLMDIQHTEIVLKEIETEKIKIVESYKEFPSPFSFHLIIQGYSDIFKIEDKVEFLKRMHEKVLARIENPKAKEEFSYHELWRLAEEGKQKDREEEKEELKREAWNVEKVPMFAKEAIIKMIDGEDIEQNIIDEFKKYIEEIKNNFPAKLKKFVLKYIEQHDYQHILMKQFTDAYQKVKFDDDIYYEGRAVINGKRTYVAKKFKDYIEGLLKGAIPYAWKNEIVKFLMKMRDELD